MTILEAFFRQVSPLFTHPVKRAGMNTRKKTNPDVLSAKLARSATNQLRGRLQRKKR